MAKDREEASYLIDLHGLREAFTTKNNQNRAAVIDALASGKLRIMRAASDELKELDEDVYKDFQSAATSKKYVKTLRKHEAVRASLMHKFGASLFGVSPPPERFEAIAICACEKLDLITNGKAQLECEKIVKKCGVGKPSVLSVTEFAKL